MFIIELDGARYIVAGPYKYPPLITAFKDESRLLTYAVCPTIALLDALRSFV